VRNEKPTILFISENFPPETNAAATRVFERGIYWKKWGYGIQFITSFPNRFKGKSHIGYSDQLYQYDDIEGLNVLRVKTYIPKKPGTFFRLFHQLSFMIASLVAGLLERKTNIIIATTPQFFCGISGLLLSKMKRIPFILEVADIWTDSIKGTITTSSLLYVVLRWLETLVYKKSDAIIVLTYSFKEEIISRGIDNDKVVVIRNGVELSPYSNRRGEKDIKHEHSIKNNKKVIGYVGSLGAAQGLLNVVNTARILEKEHADVLFMFVGEGDEKEKIVRAAQGLKNVIFVGSQPRDSIPAYLFSFDIGLAHLNDNLVFGKNIPSKIFDMMAAGLPVLLVSPKGEASQIVEQYGIGRWVPAGNPKLLANVILQMLKDEPSVMTYSKNSLTASREFKRDVQARKVLDVVDLVVDRT